MVLARLLTLRTSYCISSFRTGGIHSRDLILKQKRSLHTTSSNHRVLERVRDFVFATEKENFDEVFVKRAHKWDDVNEKEWTLIYRDLGASRSFLLVTLVFPAFIVGVITIGYELQQAPTNRMGFYQRLIRDANELGYFLLFPAIALVIVIALILRVHQCRLLRIYQNSANPEKFSAVASKMIVGQTRVAFDRMECSSFYHAEDQSDVMKLLLTFLFGNLHIGNRRFLVMDDCFRGNNFRSFMVNETSVSPRLNEKRR